MDISERENIILWALVDTHIATGEPVGSRTISKTGVGISPATIRNTMVDLEEKGLIYQPHTSAGRVPTDQGYRCYVDHLMPSEALEEAQAKGIRTKLLASLRDEDAEEILEQISRIIADISLQLGVVLSPRFEGGIFHRLELIPLTERRIMVVLSIESGLVRTMVIEVASPFENAHLSLTTQALNERLSGLTIGELQKEARERLRDVPRGDPKLLRVILDETASMFSHSHSGDLHLGGTGNIFRQPDFQDREALVGIFNLLEARDPIVDVLEGRTEKEGVTITIGNENCGLPEIRSCSVVTSRYRVGGASGLVGIIGPKRMRYPLISSLVRFVAQITEELFNQKS